MPKASAERAEEVDDGSMMSAAKPLPFVKTSSTVRLFCMTIIIFSAVSSCYGQQAGELKQQLQQLKRQYEQTTQELQQRISVLEQKIEQQGKVAQKEKETTASTAKLAAENAAQKAVFGGSENVGAKYQGQISSTPTYDLLQEAETKIDGL